jgi:putative transposase
MTEIKSRKRPASGVYVRSDQLTIVFLTICTKDRKPWHAQPQVHQLLKKVWRESTAWLVGRYVIMPDHIHLFCSPGPSTVPLENWVRYWKSQFSKEQEPILGEWQSKFWDRRLRSNESYAIKWEYVLNNPIRHGLARTVTDWPYKGEIYVLE